MGKTLLTTSLLSLSLAISSALFSTAWAGEDKVIATVNGEDIKQSSLDALNDLMKRSNRAGKVSKSMIMDDLVITEIVRQEAQKSGIADREDIKQKLKEIEERLVINTWTADKAKSLTISDEDIKAAYDKRMKDQPTKEYHARHILLKTEAEAKVIIDELNKGADFAELAKKKSTGPSGPSGGDLGWFSPKAMVAPFSEAVAKMEKGKYSTAPVKTKFGYHIIKLEDTRDLPLPSLESVKPQLKRVIEQEKMKDYIDSLRANADVKILIDVNKADKKAEAPSDVKQATTTEKK